MPEILSICAQVNRASRQALYFPLKIGSKIYKIFSGQARIHDAETNLGIHDMADQMLHEICKRMDSKLDVIGRYTQWRTAGSTTALLLGHSL